MFRASPFNRDPFHRLPFSSPFSYSNYIAPNLMPHRQPEHTHDPRRQHRHMPNAHPRHHSPQIRHRRLPRRHSHYSEISPSSSEPETPDEAYYMDTSDPNPLHSRMHDSRRSWKHRGDHDNDGLDLESEFRRIHAKVCRRTAEQFGRDEILILPPTLTRLRVQIKSDHGSVTLCATVAGDMRFRDVVKQLVPSVYTGEVRAYVKIRGAWQEPGLFLVSQIMEQGRFVLGERGVLGVKIEIGRRAGGEGGIRGVKAWERERGRTWEIRS